MAYKQVVQIPLNTINRIELYDNRKTRYSLNTIKAKMGCDYAINGGFFSMKTFEFCRNVKINGAVKSNPGYREYGIAWNTSDIDMREIPNNATSIKNYLGVTPLLYHNAVQNVTDSALYGKRGRSAVGLKPGYLVLYCTKDGTSYGKSPSDLRTELKGLGCTDILMLDGGGSSQCNFKGTTITSSRTVANVLLVYLKKNTATVTTPPATTTIVAAPVTMTPTAATLSATINLRKGPGTKYSKIGTIAKGSKVSVIGKTVAGDWYRIDKGWISATYTYLNSNKTSTSACPYAVPTVTVKYGSSGNNVRWVQWMLKNKFGYSLTIDGSFGPSTKKAVIDFQNKHGLSADGCVGPITRAALRN